MQIWRPAASAPPPRARSKPPSQPAQPAGPGPANPSLAVPSEFREKTHSLWLLNRDGRVREPNFVAMCSCLGRSPARPCSTGPHSRHRQPWAPWNCFKIQGRSSLNSSPLVAFQKKSLVVGQGSFPSLPLERKNHFLPRMFYFVKEKVVLRVRYDV